MPKVNVYLPDDLADAVRESGLPLSAICQRALELSVRRVTAIRSATLDDLDALTQFTDRAKTAIRLAIARARADGVPEVGAEHLLHGILTEGANLALHILRLAGADPAALSPALSTGDTPADRFGPTAATALEMAVTESLTHGHNYVGCEHLLLGILADPTTLAAQTLHTHGITPKPTRAAVLAALAGYTHLRATTPDPTTALTAALRTELTPILTRLTTLEHHTGLTTP
ncbi:Clp protease N-terminal domain-containing protein [Actinokineospora terrae]|uniref:Clp amino terminal domain-containing protein, pathogenicity island component n=1 Tax=Actinokineospora terrae TaxID=155974 RepID=A0A1H9L7L0_9PSEU|nr:Clp protease N-terminal domain-containing protein [Actinokineospora terrae]SER07501.1 Clp amino terminal domain-containing protein, pathogenicity island component [Actinokineospora terrae]